jgi:hypothetical protein
MKKSFMDSGLKAVEASGTTRVAWHRVQEKIRDGSVVPYE